ncbi:hypothetical protein LOZ53_005569 [Ophidiomyces ophidiicola]|nr:hypothetical protein LOZ55_005338 [Ophidiomyces ophidiicola]KAI1984188.1 hypothetical protein LOZ53_005569 [Ophidiomyces ophidiicola]KAI1985647.1 hypothetical protein LOZ54_004134 [Ophidiomyces ophidiicola]KAI1989297.1 hypothetical protein LOZ51_005106 [Ophidiomyces ophidiicola]
MQLSSFLRATLLAASSLVAGGAANASSQPPMYFGMLLFPSFQALDVFGPLDALNLLAATRTLNLSLIAASLDPVSTKSRSKLMNKFNSTFGESVVPTHTFSTAPENLEVLFVPGGIGTLAPDIVPAIQFIKETYPKLRYILSVCTGAQLLARAGVLDNRSATTNKQSWNNVVKTGPKVKWVQEARWVVDGNVWTSSGVSAGIDATLAFIDSVYGTIIGKQVADWMEYERTTDWQNDPFVSKINNTVRP